MEKPSFYWGIASYNRADRQPMLQSLSKMGYRREEIILSTQTAEDYEVYNKEYGEMATVIFREGNSVGDNKNTILQYLQEHCDNTRCVMCSDKVRAVKRLCRDNKLHAIDTREDMDAFVKKAFFVTNQVGASLFGVSPVANNFYMSHTMSTNLFLIGCFMGIPNPSAVRFDPIQRLKEDWEIGLNVISKGGRTLRFNDVCLVSSLHTKGGCHGDWNSNGDKTNWECTQRLLAIYPNLVKPHATRQNELRYVGEKQKINQSIFEI